MAAKTSRPESCREKWLECSCRGSLLLLEFKSSFKLLDHYPSVLLCQLWLISLLFIDSCSLKPAEVKQPSAVVVTDGDTYCKHVLTYTVGILSQRSPTALRQHRGSYSTFHHREKLPSACEWLLFGSLSDGLLGLSLFCPAEAVDARRWHDSRFTITDLDGTKIPQCVCTDNTATLFFFLLSAGYTFAFLYFWMFGQCVTGQGVCFYELSLEKL